jgi:hypothetical protein
MAALDEAARQFTEQVFLPALKAPRGVKRLWALFENWISWPRPRRLPGGCPIDAASREYDHHPARCAMRCSTASACSTASSARRCSSRSTRRARAGHDPRQVAFEMLGTIMVCFRSEMLFGADEAHRARTAFERLLASTPLPPSTNADRRGTHGRPLFL